MSPTLPHRLANGRTRDAFEIAAAGRIGATLANDVKRHHLSNARFGFALPSFAPADIADALDKLAEALRAAPSVVPTATRSGYRPRDDGPGYLSLSHPA